MRKSTSPLDDLPAHQAECLTRWLIEDKPTLTYREARERMRMDFNIETSEAALCAWRGRKIQDRILDRITSSAAKAVAVKEEILKSKADVFETLLAKVGSDAFTLSMEGEEIDLETLKVLKDIALAGVISKTESKKLKQKDALISQAERKVVLLENAAREAKEKLTKALTQAKGGLTPEGLAQIQEAANLL